MPDIRQLIVL